MQKFERHRSVAEIQAAVEASGGFTIDTAHYEGGGDHVLVRGVFGGMPAELLYSDFNGRFFGWADGRVWVNSEIQDHDEEPWFQAMLGFFYIERPAAVAREDA